MKAFKMIYERLDLGLLSVDIQKLQAHIKDHVLPLEYVLVGSFFGGWSVWSSDGDYKDGYQRGHLIYDPTFMPGATLRWQEAASTRSPSTSTMHARQLPSGR